MPNTHIWPCGNTSHNLGRKAQHSHLTTNVIKAQHLQLTIRGTNPPCQKALHLHLTTNVRRACTHIWSCRNQSYSHIRMAPSPRLSYLVTEQVPPFQEWHSVLISDHVWTNPTVISEWISTYIWHVRNNSSHHDRMDQPLHLTMEGTNPLTMSEWL